jgi:hypothetical protein
MKIICLFILMDILLFTGCQPGNRSPKINGTELNGSWTYRSLLNGKNVNTDFDSLAFAAATMELNTSGKDSVKGVIYWFLDSLNTIKQGLVLSGKYFYNDTTTCYFMEGIGDKTLLSEGWQYNYQGYAIPKWPEGVEQATVFVGSVVRVKKHSCDSLGNNCHLPGVVASTYMVKQ